MTPLTLPPLPRTALALAFVGGLALACTAAAGQDRFEPYEPAAQRAGPRYDRVDGVPSFEPETDVPPRFTLRAAPVAGITAGAGDADGGELLYGGEAALGLTVPSLVVYPGDVDSDFRFDVEYRYLDFEESDNDGVQLHDLTFNIAEQARIGRFKPFAGLGAGASLISLSSAGDEDAEMVIDYGDDEIGFMAQAFVGFGFEVTRNLDVEVRVNYAYRFFDFEAPEGEDFEGVSFPEGGFDADVDTLTASVGLTLRL